MLALFRGNGIRFQRLIFVLLAVLCANTDGQVAHAQGIQVPPVGLTFLSKTSGNRQAVIFVHGIGGHPLETFQNTADGTVWPVALSRDLNEFDVAVYGYETTSKSTLDIGELANHLHYALSLQNVFKSYNRIHFVAHSLGGILTQSLIVNLRDKDQSSNSAPYQKIGHVFLLGVPSRGERFGGLIKYFTDMNPAIVNALTGLHENEAMRQLDGRWSNAVKSNDRNRSMKVHCFYEKKPVEFRVGPIRGPAFLVVPLQSITDGCDGPKLAMDEDHVTLVKPPRWHKNERTIYHIVIEALISGQKKVVFPKPPSSAKTPPGSGDRACLEWQTVSYGDHNLQEDCENGSGDACFEMARQLPRESSKQMPVAKLLLKAFKLGSRKAKNNFENEAGRRWDNTCGEVQELLGKERIDNKPVFAGKRIGDCTDKPTRRAIDKIFGRDVGKLELRKCKVANK